MLLIRPRRWTIQRRGLISGSCVGENPLVEDERDEGEIPGRTAAGNGK